LAVCNTCNLAWCADTLLPAALDCATGSAGAEHGNVRPAEQMLELLQRWVSKSAKLVLIGIFLRQD